MVGRRFHSLPGFRPEYGTGFIGFLIGIGIPAEDDVLRRFFDFVEMGSAAKGNICPFINGTRIGRRLIKRVKSIEIAIRIDDPRVIDISQQIPGGNKGKAPFPIGKRPVAAGGLL